MRTITKAEFFADPDRWVRLTLGTEQVEVRNPDGSTLFILGRGHITETEESPETRAYFEQLEREAAGAQREDLDTSWFD